MAANIVRASSQYLNLPYNATQQEFGADDFTIMAWILWKAPLLNNNGSILGRWEPTGDKRRFDFRKLNTNKLGFVLSTNGQNGGIQGGASSLSLTQDVIQHVAIRRESGTGRLYIDGAIDAFSLAISGTIPTDATINMAIGSQRESTAVNIFDGYLWDVRIYTKALLGAEIKTIYESRGNDNIVDSLVGRYLLNELPSGSTVSNVLDISNIRNDGTDTNSPTYIDVPMKILK